MNFFEQQRQAKKQTSRLVIIFIIALVFIIASIHFSIAFALSYSQFNTATGFNFFYFALNPTIFLYTTGSVSAIIFIASIFKSFTLRGGGKDVCQQLGATLVHRNTNDFACIQYFNVVEEMSIASGVPMPLVYILEDDNINAFAAGHTIKNAAVCVTRGALNKLSRDELQAVMAHEYGHIFNGDMLLNIKLMAYIYGLLVLSQVGYLILRVTGRNSRSRSSSSDKGAGGIIIVGFILLAFGWLGSIFASLIKAFISRQREFLADASAVQYTRNGPAMVSVFKKILASQSGSVLESPNASEVSHMFFTKGVKEMFSTHPPLDERIKRIDKNFNLRKFNSSERKEIISNLALHNNNKSSSTTQNIATPQMASSFTGNINHLTQRSGSIDQEALIKAKLKIDMIPLALKYLAHNLFGAKSIICSYLLDSKDTLRREQIEIIKNIDLELGKETERVYDKIKSHSKDLRLPLIEMAVSSIKSLPPKSFESFNLIIKKLVDADGKVNLFELLVQNLIATTYKSEKPKKQNLSKEKLSKEIAVVLKILTKVSYKEKNEQIKIYNDFISKLGLKLPKEKMTLSYSELVKSLENIDLLQASDKQVVLDAMIYIILHDGKITYQEQELLSLLALSMSVPMPLL